LKTERETTGACGYLLFKATPVDVDVTGHSSVQDDDVDASELCRQTVSGRPGAVRSRQFNAIDDE